MTERTAKAHGHAAAASTRARGTTGEAETGAMAQLRARGYADKYRAPGRAVCLIGIEISAERRDIAAFDVEPA